MKEGILVEKGSFRVDPRRALRKLRDFQAASVLPAERLWIRAANAAGASEIEFSRWLTEFSVRFDGHPLSARFFEDPFRCLLDDRSASGRFEIHTARALLRELRESPKSVVVRSGGRRLRLTGIRPAARSTEKDPSPPEGTSVYIRWPLWRSLRLRRAGSEALAPLVHASRARIVVESEVVEPERPAPAFFAQRVPERRFRRGGFSGSVRALARIPKAANRSKSVLHPSLDGVSLDPRGMRSVPAAIEAWAESGRWRLNASQTGVVADRVLEEGIEVVGEAAEELIRSQIKRQTERAEAVGKALVSGDGEKLLRNGHLLSPEEAAGISKRAVSLCVDLHRALWLRDAVVRARRGDRVLRALLERAPLFWSPRGRPLSVRTVRRQNAGLVRYVDEPDARGVPGNAVVWCVFGREDRRWLSRLIDAKQRRVRV